MKKAESDFSQSSGANELSHSLRQADPSLLIPNTK
jgi:hypothetical protein